MFRCSPDVRRCTRSDFGYDAAEGLPFFLKYNDIAAYKPTIGSKSVGKVIKSFPAVKADVRKVTNIMPVTESFQVNNLFCHNAQPTAGMQHRKKSLEFKSRIMKMLNNLGGTDKIVALKQDRGIITIEGIKEHNAMAVFLKHLRQGGTWSATEIKTFPSSISQSLKHRRNQPRQEPAITLIDGIVLVQVVYFFFLVLGKPEARRDKDQLANPTLQVLPHDIPVKKIRVCITT